MGTCVVVCEEVMDAAEVMEVATSTSSEFYNDALYEQSMIKNWLSLGGDPDQLPPALARIRNFRRSLGIQ